MEDQSPTAHLQATIKRLPRESKVDFVTRVVRNSILTGDIPEGYGLRQRHLAELLGVSATPVREALSRLYAEGYVAAEVQRGAVVRPLAEVVAEHRRLRTALEALAAEMAAQRASGPELLDAKRSADLFASAANQEDAERHDRDFHLAICRHAAAPILTQFVTQMWNTRRGSQAVWRARDTLATEHSAILRCIVRGEAHAAAEHAARHVAGEPPGADGPRP